MNNTRDISIHETEKSNTQEIFRFLSSPLMYVVTGLICFFALLVSAGLVWEIIASVLNIIVAKQLDLPNNEFRVEVIKTVIFLVLKMIPYVLVLKQFIGSIIGTIKTITSAKTGNRKDVINALGDLRKAVSGLRVLVYAGYVLGLILITIMFSGAAQGIAFIMLTAMAVLLHFFFASIMNFVESIERRVHSPAIAVAASCIDVCVFSLLNLGILFGIPLFLLALKFHKLDMTLGNKAYKAYY